MKKTEKKPSEKSSRKRVNSLPLLAVMLCMTAVLLTGCNGTSSGSEGSGSEISGAGTIALGESPVNPTDDITQNSETDRGNNGIVTVGPGESLVIPTTDIAMDASFFPVEANGTMMEVIAVKDDSGNIRTAFNTCQICYSSGRGYYKQSGKYLVCQNCGNRFTMDQVGVQSGGCNPWPIFEEDRTQTEDEILISYDFLLESQGIFANWKTDY